jgi:hypothetical protein
MDCCGRRCDDRHRDSVWCKSHAPERFRQVMRVSGSASLASAASAWEPPAEPESVCFCAARFAAAGCPILRGCPTSDPS